MPFSFVFFFCDILSVKISLYENNILKSKSQTLSLSLPFSFSFNFEQQDLASLLVDYGIHRLGKIKKIKIKNKILIPKTPEHPQIRPLLHDKCQPRFFVSVNTYLSKPVFRGELLFIKLHYFVALEPNIFPLLTNRKRNKNISNNEGGISEKYTEKS